MLLVEEMVSPGGPSGPVWAFFTAISLALIGVLGQQIAARHEAKAAKHEASKANENAAKAAQNTTNISNGFVGRMDRKLDCLQQSADETQKALREHLAWHLEKEGKR
jgi:hypothetical protein